MITLSRQEARAFLAQRGNRHVGEHAMKGRIGKKPPLPWVFCTNCGLLNLKNDVTRRALRAPCVWED